MGADSAVKFSDNPPKHLLSEGDHSYYKALINGLLTKTTAVPPIAEGEEYECDVLMIGELKKKSTPDTVDDVGKNSIRGSDMLICVSSNKKVLSNATHIMGADPTRRFMFGSTIEKFNVRLWFFSRSHIFVTEAMNVHMLGEYRETTKLVHAISSPSITEAITVQKAKFLLGRATRLFKVRQVFNDEGDLDSEVKAIKDY
ncbi:hypothetical protein F5876DRAFT_71679 [Lentinula aff. lateritia]|uniref:Uncharacterized protein n=1 Tax=Lentinula aff. lateritia TaxID=2804960 RepID=A0ACC1UFT8_9AGAR|nr:hypothetical protein F5876DRAFT_71679 [Lentinula aff. lateritia]